MKKKIEWGEFCNIVGITPRNIVLEYFLEGREMDFGRGDIARATGLKRATVYRIIAQLLKEKDIISTRKISGSQLYKLNMNKREIRVLFAIFDVILDKIAEEHMNDAKILSRTKKEPIRNL